MSHRRIPDGLDPATLRWLADRTDEQGDALRDLANKRQLLLNTGQEIKVTDVRDEHVARCREIARDRSSEARWMRSAATRIENRRRGPRGHAQVGVFLWLVVAFAFGFVVMAGAAHALWVFDHALAERAAAELREGQCERGWHATNVRAHVLREEIAEHLAIEEDGPCSCWVAP